MPRPSPEGASTALSLSLQLGARIHEWPVSRARIRRWVKLALQRDARLSLRLVARAEAIALNTTFRGLDYAPNVLTFEYGPAPSAAALRKHAAGLIPQCMADIAICLPVVREEARSQGKTLSDHLAHLVIHGVLHAQGYDHVEEADAQKMESLEIRLLARLRISNPYLDEKSPSARRAV